MNALQNLWNCLIEEELKRKTDGEEKGEQKRWRPKLHIAPPAGWLNDPNGLCQCGGVYHAFYQFSPFEVKGGLKFWGHCVSRDLLHWEFLGTPLGPDQPFDCHGAYSGSALVEDGKIYAFYTGNVKEQGEHDYILTGRQSNTVLAASADGIHFEEKDLLMENADYPSDLSCHIRDPKVWKQDGLYYMIQGARTKEDKGVAILFSSEEKRSWKYAGRLETEEDMGYMWECPDLYELDGRTVLSISPQGLKAEGLSYNNVYQSLTCFLEGDFRESPRITGFRELDGGFDFYAPQTFLAEDGRRIQIAWMGLPDIEEFYSNPTVEDGWQHMMTIPRELSVRDGVLCQNPVRELEGWWNEEEVIADLTCREIAPCCEINLEPGGGNVGIMLAGGLKLSYDCQEKIFWMRFEDADLGAGRTVRGRKVECLESLRILVDSSSVEVFLNGGTDVLTTRFYPKESQYTVQVEGADCRYRYRVEA